MAAAVVRHSFNECVMLNIVLNNLVKEMGSEVTMFADDTRLFNIEKSKLWEYIPNKLENTITALSAFMVRCQSDMKKNSYSFVLPSKGREGNTDDAKERPAASSLQKRLLK